MGILIKTFITVSALMFHIAPAQAGPLSRLYLTDGNGGVQVVQGNAIVNSWGSPSGPGVNASPSLAVLSSVRTYSDIDTGIGHEFALDGTPTGTTYANTVGCCFRDGTTDGIYNYALRAQFGDSIAYRFGLDWTNPEVFDLSFTNGVNIFTIGTASGIAWDPRDNSFWLAGDGAIFNIDAARQVIAGFLIPDTSTGYAVAFDTADNTVWLTTNSGAGGFSTLLQYAGTKAFSGRPVPLDTLVLSGINILGAEFALASTVSPVPEPESWVLLLVGFTLVGGMMRQRRANPVAI